ncbi:MAG TPA: site-2 protease family protein [Cyclobacteriaceae bacterium]|jgi:membrane-associated protease RseP (regulator of RpoE activity)|nr:site-2 protease family protein [Cyclobacteriaceae bacterium]
MKITPKEILIHSSLFIVTFITTTLAGAEWTYGRSIYGPDFSFNDFVSGMSYSIPFLFILTVHEFGHYFTARYYKIGTTLPYYIPLPFLTFTFGTLGALIRIKAPVESKQQHFDIGIAGPLAGFVATLIVLMYGFMHLPPADYIFQIHPEYAQYGANYADHVYDVSYMTKAGGFDVTIGKTLLYSFFEKFIGDPARIPNAHEIMHYPFLFAGFLSLIFTSINLLPIGQLDGGHVLYGLLGFKGHRSVATIFFIVFLFYAGLGYVSPHAPNAVLMWEIPLYIGFLYLCLTGLRLEWKDTLMYALVIFVTQFLLVKFIPGLNGYSGWLVFAFLLGRFMGIQHPPSRIEEPLNMERQVLGWIAVLIFIISFSPAPIEIMDFTIAAP